MNHTIRHRVGLVGAGHISEFHAAAVQRIPGVELVGICDLDTARAQDAARRFGTRAFGSLEELRANGADVVHVLTPPDSHAAIALHALELGMHVLVEKPLATDVADCRRIVAEADRRGLRVCVNHSMLYDPQVARALKAVRAGHIGKIVSVDILRSSVFPTYEGGQLPPQYRSAGYPFRDLGVHALYLFEAFLGPIEDVTAQWASFGGDKNLVFDEWRAQVRCRDGLGQFQLSWNVTPIQNLVIVQGTKGVLRIDAMRMFAGEQVLTGLPKPADRLLGIYSNVLGPVVDYAKSVVGVARKTIVPYHGVQALIAEFYRSLDEGSPVPVSAADAISSVEWVERIARAAEAEAAVHAARTPALAETVPVLVTGAAGAVGGAVVARLVERGERVRIFVRRAPAQVADGVEVCIGDLRNPAAVERAVRGARAVIHAGAQMSGGWPEMLASTVVGTRNVVEACLKYDVAQLVHISSMSVPQWTGAPDGAPLSESSPVEPRPEERDGYTHSKLQAELLVRDAVRERGLPAVILRPGLIFGGPLKLITAAVARRLGGRYLVFGDGTVRPPFVYLDDVVDAIVAALDRGLKHGELIQIIDTDTPTQNEVLHRADPGAGVIHAPKLVLFALARLSELLLKHRSPLRLYRLRSALAKRSYVSDSANLLGWTPRVGVSRGIAIVTGPRQQGDRPSGSVSLGDAGGAKVRTA